MKEKTEVIIISWCKMPSVGNKGKCNYKGKHLNGDTFCDIIQSSKVDLIIDHRRGNKKGNELGVGYKII